jgi:hypothetical protein
MNKITFDEMLRANGLPPVGATVTTPRGDKVEVSGYAFDKYKHCVVIQCDNGYIDWTFDQIRLCTWEGREI